VPAQEHKKGFGITNGAPVQHTPQVYNPDPPTPAPDAASARNGRFARLSLEQKLPLIVAGLLLAVMGAISVVSYVEVRATTRQMADERLVNLTQQVGVLFAMSGQNSRAQAAALAARPGFAAFAKSRNARNRARAIADLKWISANPDAVIATELRDRNGIVLTTATGAATSLPVPDVLPPGGDSIRIGQFLVWRDTLIYATSTPVKGNDQLFVVRWRRIVLREQTRKSIESIFGTWGTPYLGNPGGVGWVDFRTRVAAPPMNFADTAAVQEYRHDGQDFIASKYLIPGTPWAILLEVPTSTVMAPANAFLRRFLLVGLIALAIALFAARAITRRVTQPILQLADSATALAAGDFSRAVSVNRQDELGDLGRSFAQLANEVQTTREQLESKVLERTKDLNDALYRLHGAHESLVRRERLAFLGQLASGIGHELRNPLGVMTNSVYLLRLVVDPQPGKAQEYLDILTQQITLSEKIVGDLLDFARAKPPQRKPTSLTEVSERQVERLRARDGVTIESSLNGNIPPVLVDSHQLSQILLNLLTNAVQAVEGTGHIRIRAHAAEDSVRLDVMDSGPGIPPQNLEKIFEPLFTTKARGIGLGLAVSRTLARANGGDLSATNNPTGGAAFHLTLPVAANGNGGNGHGGNGGNGGNA
jgi:signal transduction histidine kinase